MPNGCDLPITNVSDDDIALIKRKHNIPNNIPLFIYTGRMIWYKNIELILDACAMLKNEGKDFRLMQTKTQLRKKFANAVLPTMLFGQEKY